MPGRYEFSLPERPVRDGWIRIGTLDITTTALAVLLGAASMVVWAIDKATVVKLMYFGPLVADGELWRVLTWPIANPPDQIFVVFTLAFFWFVGHRIEDLVGKRRFAILLVAMTVLPASVATLFDLTASTGLAYGLGVLGTALLVVYALEYPNVMFLFNIPAWIIAGVIVLIHVLQLLGDRSWGMLVILLGAIAVAVVGARLMGLLSDLPMLAALGGKRHRAPRPARRTTGPRSGRSAGRARSNQQRGQVVSGPWGPTSGSSGTASTGVTGHSSTDQATLDALLDKIASGGMDSLSRDEKAQLNDLSRRLRDR